MYDKCIHFVLFKIFSIPFMSRLGPKMAELLFTWGELYPQIKPLVTVIKHWAKVQGLTRPEPGPRVSNFMLIMMAVCYLQSLEVVPSFRHMQELAGKELGFRKKEGPPWS